jgi:hypothetical protein
MADKQAEADFYMDQFLNDFSEISLGLGADVLDPEKVINAIKKIYAENNKTLIPFG